MSDLNTSEKTSISKPSPVKTIRDLGIHPSCELMPAMDEATYAALLADIETNGLQVPLKICDGKIIDGRARYRACRTLGIEPALEEIPSSLGSEVAVISHNLIRKHWPEGTRAMLAAQLATTALGSNQHSTDTGGGSTSQQVAAQRLGISIDSLQRCKKVIDRKIPDLSKAVQHGEVAVRTAFSAAKRLSDSDLATAMRRGSDIGLDRALKIALADVVKKKKAVWNVQRAAISANDAPLPTGKRYGLVLADPAWNHIPELLTKYPTMSTEEICRLPVSELAAKDAVAFVWVPAGQVPDGLKVLEAWGFTYKGQFVWDKERPGTGVFVRYRHEVLLIGTRGSLPEVSPELRPESILRGTATKHSAKPLDAYVRIEQMYPELSKIELFCRGEPRSGWAGWGNQCAATHPSLNATGRAIQVVLAADAAGTRNTSAANDCHIVQVA